VEIMGLKELPESGELFFSVENEKMAKLISQRRKWHKEESGEK